MKYRISANVIRRLPRYLRRLTGMERAGEERTSSRDLSSAMGLTASQIRQDLNCFGGFGQQGYGYRVRELREGIAAVLGIGETLRAVVVGVGNLGRALLANFRFDECGVEVTAAFDADPALIGRRVSEVSILESDALEGYLKENPVDVIVLTLPRKFVKDVSELAARNGVRGIWNFTGIDIDADLGDTIVENVHLSDSLLTLGYYLRGRMSENQSHKEET